MSAFVTYLITGLALGCTFALVASGFVTIHRVTGVVNFAQGAFAVVAGLSAGALLARGLPHGVAEAAAIALAGVVGLVVGVIAIGKRGTSPLASLVITLGLGILIYAIEIIVFGDQPISFPGLPGAVQLGGARILSQYFLVIAVALVTFAALGVFFDRTYLGKALTACASNPYAARLVGINVTRMGCWRSRWAGCSAASPGCWSPRCSRWPSTPTSPSPSTASPRRSSAGSTGPDSPWSAASCWASPKRSWPAT
jgi:branched-chain amino acid transport system permease protein